ncbi:hypothetical protein [Rossellomorea aquimaris]|jgi:hypothetical protein|uniref:Uncharacterized protein n=1 Tax=Rossellomorea aquimaris TaxID=189382 RepID=A0A5D4TNK5_9BACI|nr:hypothetical protein [Rossellomorea aquimaris]TYS77287.1 hypothetical protein FZD05_11590 [Rossellomorea aquimaris]TYS86464.1 hypothetical protein FZC85_05490 [Rossellomorea aquimaris]TYS91795.1 hypothetical protein FZC88_06575 [Rossellomorea aquimaris]
MRLESFDALLEAYRQIWKNRLLISEGTSSEKILKETIKRELLDGNSHPRVRKSKEEKYLSATKRIIESDLTSEEQVSLIKVHLEMVSQLNRDT